MSSPGSAWEMIFCKRNQYLAARKWWLSWWFLYRTFTARKKTKKLKFLGNFCSTLENHEFSCDFIDARGDFEDFTFKFKFHLSLFDNIVFMVIFFLKMSTINIVRVYTVWYSFMYLRSHVEFHFKRVQILSNKFRE
jgi:hypothetical protein